jgi:hypothetical protein
MFYSGPRTCHGWTLPRRLETELLSRRDGMIDNDVIAGETTCPTCGAVYGYTRKPTPTELDTIISFDTMPPS